MPPIFASVFLPLFQLLNKRGKTVFGFAEIPHSRETSPSLFTILLMWRCDKSADKDAANKSATALNLPKTCDSSGNKYTVGFRKRSSTRPSTSQSHSTPTSPQNHQSATQAIHAASSDLPHFYINRTYV